MGKIVAIDLFSGAGGTTRGLKNAGIEVKAAVEIDPIASRTYSYNNKEVLLFDRDIAGVAGKELVEQASIGTKDKLLLVACPPCQGFSTIGTNDHSDVRNQMIFQYLRLINELKPDFLLMENVPGLMRGKNNKLFQKFINGISKEYDIVYDVLNTADFGVPQTRKRLVLHGVRKGFFVNEEKVRLPEATHSKDGERGLSKWVNADIIMDLPPISAGEEFVGKNVYNHIANNLSELNLTRIKYIRHHGGSRNSLPEELQLRCHIGKKGHGDVYGILDKDKPSITITGGCMSYSKGRFGHPTQDRALSAREAARLQSFDDDYIFFGNRSQLAQQIGNAVPVKLAEASGKYFQTLLSEENR